MAAEVLILKQKLTLHPMKNANILKYLFILVVALELGGHIFRIPEINQFSKPLLMPVLLVYFKRAMKAPLNLSFMLASLALIFSWIGDVFLMFQIEYPNFFLFGLGAFAVAQILYITTFLKARRLDETASDKGKIVYTIPFIIFTIAFLWYLWPVIGELKLPVAIYSFLLTGMAIAAIFRMEQTNLKSFNLLFFGSVLFVLSDSLIAVNKFLNPMEHAGLFIMITYILAQWNIINGLLLHYNEENI